LKGTAYLVQGTLISLWWLGLATNESFYTAFQFPEISPEAFNSFFAPDILIITVLSLVRAYKPNRELELIILGGFAYGSLYCLNATLLTSGGYLPSTIMVLGLFYNLFLVYQSKVFRETKSQNLAVTSFKTFVQIICVWSITLFLFPWIIMDAFEIQGNSSEIMKIASYIIFGLFSILGLWSSFVMVRNGKGTPLPVDQTKKLVINGSYKYVRNPMAIAGIGQGLAISLFLGSVHILVYCLIGGLVWQFVVRPLEEKNMVERFGSDYEKYRAEVNLWIPNFKKNSK